MTTQTIDQARAEAFAGEVVGALNSAFSTLMISVGQRTGLFDKLATLPPSITRALAIRVITKSEKRLLARS